MHLMLCHFIQQSLFYSTKPLTLIAWPTSGCLTLCNISTVVESLRPVIEGLDCICISSCQEYHGLDTVYDFIISNISTTLSNVVAIFWSLWVPINVENHVNCANFEISIMKNIVYIESKYIFIYINHT